MVKLCLLGGSGFDVGKEWFVATLVKGTWEGDWLGELEVVSEGVVFGDVVVVEDDDDEVFSTATFAVSNKCFPSSFTLLFTFDDWQAADNSIGNKGSTSSGVGGATLLWVGCELGKKLYN